MKIKTEKHIDKNIGYITYKKDKKQQFSVAYNCRYLHWIAYTDPMTIFLNARSCWDELSPDHFLKRYEQALQLDSTGLYKNLHTHFLYTGVCLYASDKLQRTGDILCCSSVASVVGPVGSEAGSDERWRVPEMCTQGDATS